MGDENVTSETLRGWAHELEIRRYGDTAMLGRIATHLHAEANRLDMGIGFYEMVGLLEDWLDRNYPKGTVVCTDKLPDESGPTLTWDLRAALDKYHALNAARDQK